MGDRRITTGPTDPLPSIGAVLTSPAIEALADAVEAGGLIPRGSTGVVMVSGGADSACTAAALAALRGPAAVAGLHINYALRPDSGADERAARALCAKLRIDLHVERPELAEGNLQARAREARYAAAERLRSRIGAEWIATGHTRTDIAETMLYRLAASPGTRPLLGLAPRNGAVVRPLHSISREETRAVAEEAGLPFVDDPTNSSPRYARNRIRAEVLPVLAEIAPEVERNVAATHAELHEEAELLAGLVADALDRAGVGDGSTAIDGAELARMGPALARLALRELTSRAAGRQLPLNRARAAQIIRVAGGPESAEVELGGGVLALCEGGQVELMAARRDPVPGSVWLGIPGVARFGDWELRAELREGPLEPAGPELATLDAATVGESVEVRAWRDGDRIRPLGMGGRSKTLQDLFTDRGIPRSRRREIPLVVANGRIAWVPGLAIAEDFRLRPDSTAVAVLSAEVRADRGARV